jgi:hypothetical protein
MDKQGTLLAALRTRAEQSQQTVLGAQEVRVVGAAMGLSDGELISLLEALSERGVVRLQWGGEIGFVETEGTSSRRSDERAGPHFSGSFHGPLIYNVGEGAQIDARGSGHGATYRPGEQTEAAFGTLAAAIVELRVGLEELEGDVAAKVRALEAAVCEVAEQGTQAEPNKPVLRQQLRALTGRLEDVAKLQAAVTRLGPIVDRRGMLTP